MLRGTLLGLPVSGHMNPALGVVRELTDRGHQIQVYASPRWRDRIEAVGAVPRTYDHPDLDDIDPPENAFVLLAAALEVAQRVLPGLIQDIEGASTGERPDYLLIDSAAPWGPIVARRTGLPSMTSCSTFAMNDRVARSMVGEPRRVFQTFWEGLGALFRAMRLRRGLEREFGVEPPTLSQVMCAPADRTVVYTSRRLQPFEDSFDARTTFVGPVVSARHETWSDPLPAGFVYVSLGTLFNQDVDFYRQVVDAFRHSGPDVLLNIGTFVDPAALGDVPGHIRVVSRAPQLAVLERASAFITHGGMNSVHESLLAEVPMVVVPQAADQFMVARRIEAVGAGIWLRQGRVDSEAIASAVARVRSEPSFRERCRDVARELREAGGAPHAADIVEQLVTQKRS